LERLRIGEARIPVDSAANVLVPYRGGPKSYSYISFLDVLEKRVNPSLLKDTIAIVGTTAPGLLDLRATPMSGIYPGVEVHANLVSALLDSEKPGGIKTYYPNSEFFEFLVIFFIGLGLSFLIPIASPVIALIGFLGVEAAVVSVTQVLWTNGYVFPTASILIAFLCLYVLNTAYGFLIEAKQKRQFTSLFGQYVPPELVQKMADDPEKYSMEGRKARLTVLFSDVAGFTSISEQLSPTDLAAYINQYLTSMSMIIRESGGTLDKYIGDAIMAFWGAPVDEPEHAEKAVSAALAMQKKVDELNSEFSQRGWPLLRIGIGLSTGEMTVGDMGSQVRKAYTVMGDAVNLGSRLEGLTRMYKNKIIASQPTVDACKNFIFRELDRVRVKGKDEPVTIYEPLGMSSELASRSAELSTWKSALESYRSMNWQTCQKILADLRGKYPRDGLYEALSDYIDELRQDSLPENWDAVRKFDTK
jgi:adenylate cyclase